MVNPHKIMEEAAKLALLGKGYNKTNPVVGACVVKDSKIISRGYHTGYGNPHAEVEAIDNAPESVKGADLYVTLEPCSHYGKTPPCTKMIIESGIKRVFIGVVDPNPKNAGNGINELINNGIEVFVGFAENLCASLIEDFAKTVYAKEPFYTLKIAQSLDGKIATKNGASKWITSESSRIYSHYLRSISDAVLVGIDTVIKDNPSLNVRLLPTDNEPTKIILDSNLKIPLESELVTKFSKNLVIFTKEESLNFEKCRILTDLGVQIFPCDTMDSGLNLKTISRQLLDLNIMNVLVEGGSKIFGSFIREKCADKLNLFVAPLIIGDGISSIQGVSFSNIADCIKIDNYTQKQFENDILISANLSDFKKDVLELTERVRNRCSQGL
ncbi:bifunctional diaminohydroxyphosphoribosylaminopyrimidine deaminase/5-amino-6-(5-phosphoribosylamino)uracil reductase RibD [Deferribacterales bacterium Es71-Z0220]|uniref:bifunctional diaminohydroxyphosphoribosylaminopyrimidine deaminase/5-amino-6-(5-phosphoribosylamino)uracil reductase RibD n=1 Tax=Deferrivibrio essentukiensis TaxID=2880922 RepID=UPI001F6252D9|nr:bifunctional diaminohydroxyphosphoribosylaminopyrimidine deaminase/5-amino-6-(5-phosphoribosylamino)uracil reductase RibD [Deferrivibrio essentukiensis]MCB4204193.1 bifunctional diaminohydroxyphosphoribosylaminopyrimidine deaminase/5-amino-6-(5-phosphoribosylamino)uracil reductase RibD [Deferrivibrio essentukiensis]